MKPAEITNDSAGLEKDYLIIPPLPDTHQETIAFYNAIYGTSPTEFRLIRPPDLGSGIRSKWSYPDDETLDALIAYNAQGYGIFAVINQCDPRVEQRIAEGGGTTRNADIPGIRAVFVDFDSEGDNLQRIKASPLPPSVVVCSGLPHKLHAYWRVSNLPVDLFKHTQQALATHFGSDPAVSNAARVMRLPGFYNTKPQYNKPLVRLLGVYENLYSKSEIWGAFNVSSEKRASEKPFKVPPAIAKGNDTGRIAAYVRSALQQEHDAVASAVEGTRHNTLVKAAFNLGQLIAVGALEREVVEEALTAACVTCDLPDDEAACTVADGLEAGMQHPRDLSGVTQRPRSLAARRIDRWRKVEGTAWN